MASKLQAKIARYSARVNEMRANTKVTFNCIPGDNVDVLTVCDELGIEVNKHGDPIEGPEDDIDNVKALEVLREDPCLIWIWGDEAHEVIKRLKK